jgi:predicted alpha/beta-fold hydrolase
MKRKANAKLERFPGLFDGAAVARARTLREFDNLVTAPLHGYRDTDDYWTRASSKPGLAAVRVPTLLVNARNDPFLPESALPTRDEVSADVRLDYPAQGGHVGFSSSRFPGGHAWLPARVLHFLERRA